MPVIRKAKSREHPFAQISRDLIQNNALTFEARGLVIYLISKPDNWEAQLHEIEIAGNMGRIKRRRIVGELETAGYLERIETRLENGNWDYELRVHEEPLVEVERTSISTRRVRTEESGLTVGRKPAHGKKAKKSPWVGLRPTDDRPTDNLPTYIEEKILDRELQDKERNLSFISSANAEREKSFLSDLQPLEPIDLESQSPMPGIQEIETQPLPISPSSPQSVPAAARCNQQPPSSARPPFNGAALNVDKESAPEIISATASEFSGEDRLQGEGEWLFDTTAPTPAQATGHTRNGATPKKAPNPNHHHPAVDSYRKITEFNKLTTVQIDLIAATVIDHFDIWDGVVTFRAQSGWNPANVRAAITDYRKLTSGMKPEQVWGNYGQSRRKDNEESAIEYVARLNREAATSACTHGAVA